LELIQRAQAGDQEAFAALFEQYKNLVYKTAYLMLGETAETEDALQEVFVQVLKSLPAFDHRKGAFTSWLYRVTLHCCLNHRRKRRPRCLPLEGLAAMTVSGSLGSQMVEQDSIRQAVRELSEKQRAVVILRYYSELPYAEIASILDIPLGTVKSRLDLALKTVRRSLEEEEQESLSRSATKVEVCR